MKLKKELREIEREVILLTKLLLPVVLVSMAVGAVSCYISGGGCYRTMPFIYGFLGLFLTAVFYYLSPYIDTLKTGLATGEIQIFYEHISNGYSDSRRKISGGIDSFLDRLMTEENEGFEEYSYSQE